MRDKLTYFWRYWFWQLSRVFVYLYLRPKFNLRVVGNNPKIPKAPFIMVSNHGTFFDPWLVGHFSRWPLSIMNNEDAFKAPAFPKWYMRQIGTFPKKKGASDFKAMKTTLKRIKLGYPVLIFPEGQTSWDGISQPIYPGIEKIAKLSKTSLVVMHLTGNFMSKPWWANNYRKGRVEVSWKVLPADQIKKMPVEEILKFVVDNIKNNDINSKLNSKVEFVGEGLSEGITNFLWRCPECNEDDKLSASGNQFSCSGCGRSWCVDGNFNISPTAEKLNLKTLSDWAEWHRDEVINRINESGDSLVLCKNNNVIFHNIDNTGKMILISKGDLTLTKQELTYKPSDSNHKLLVFSVKNISDFIYQKKTVFECRVDGVSYRFDITNGSPMKWVYFFRYLNGFEKFEKSGILS